MHLYNYSLKTLLTLLVCASACLVSPPTQAATLDGTAILLQVDKNLNPEEYSFLKRPVFIMGDEVFVGNSKDVVEAVREVM